MNEKTDRQEEPIEQLVRAYLLHEGATVDAAGVLAGVKARIALRRPAAAAAPPPRRWAGRFALATAAAVLLAVLAALPVSTPQASAETLVREAQQAHARPVDLCYSRTEANPARIEGDFLPPLPPEIKLWARGDSFFMEMLLPNRRVNAWGRDAEGRVWFAPHRHAGFRFEAHEVPEPLARMADLRLTNVDHLLSDVLANFDLHRRDTGPGLQVVEARPKTSRAFVPLRFVRLEIDAQRKLLRKFETHRRHPQGVARVTFTLVENSPPRVDADYTLEGHLDPGARVYSLDDPPPVRMKLLRKHYESGLRNGP